MRFLAIDWGEKILGFAVSDSSGKIAFPAGIVLCPSKKQKKEAVAEKIRETGAEFVILGLPLTICGIEGKMAKKVRSFMDEIKSFCHLPVDVWDERLTTSIAEKTLKSSSKNFRRFNKKRGKDFRKREKRVDDRAATIMLQDYLDFKNSKIKGSKT